VEYQWLSILTGNSDGSKLTRYTGTSIPSTKHSFPIKRQKVIWKRFGFNMEQSINAYLAKISIW
jgi:hypothetical protein